MTTGKRICNVFNNIKIDTIKRLIVFILMFIFSLMISVSDCYADKDDISQGGVEEEITQEAVKADYTYQKQDGNLKVQVRSGVNGATKIGAVTALTIDINNSGSEFSGFVKVGIPQSKEGTLYAEKISVGSNGVTTVNVYIPVNVQTDRLKFEIVNETGNLCFKDDIKIKVYPKGCYMIGVLADKPSALTYLFSNKDSRFYYYGQDTMPEDYRGLDNLDMMIINNYNMGLLSENQYIAIKEWVLQGGTLVIGTGTGAGTVLNRLTKDFINAKVSSVDDMEISFGTTKESVTDTDTSSGEVAAPELTWLKTKVATIDMEGSITIESASSRPIIQAVNKGKGKIIVCGFSMNITDTYKDMQDKLGELIYTYSAVESETMYAKFLKSILESAKGRTPNSIIYIIILGAYVVGLMMVVTIYSKKLNTQKVSKIIIIMAVSMCIVMGVLGLGTRINKMHSSHFSLMNLEGNNIVSVEKYFNITLPNNKKRELELRERNHFFEISQEQGKTKEASGKDFNTEIIRDGEKTDVTLKGLAAFDTKLYESYGKYESKMNMSASINCWNNVYSGTIENQTGYDLDYVFILTKTGIVYVGDVPKNEKVNKESMNQASYISINEIEYLVPTLLDKKTSKMSTNSINAKGELTVNGITRILQYYMITNGIGINDEGCLLAITKSNDKVFVNNDVEEEGISVIATKIAINYTSGKEKYVPNICKDDMSFEMGNYYYSTTTNTVQLMDNVVAEYVLDKKDNIKSLEFVNSSSKDSTLDSDFKGKVSLWNYKTNQYDEVYETGKEATLSTLTDYVSSSKVIKLKFQVDEGNSGCTLPIISAIITTQ